MKRVRFVAWLLAAVAVVTLAQSPLPRLLRQEEKSQAISIGGPFAMTDHNGRAVTERDFAGKAMAVFAGFTFCPDVCPTTLTRLSGLKEKLGSDADKLQVILVSVDPERDTPEVLRTYLAAFDPGFAGLTGTPEQLAAFAKAFRIFYEKVPDSSGGYAMNHSAGVFLFRKSGEFQGTIDRDEPDKVALEKLKMLLYR